MSFYTEDNVTIYGKQFRYINSFPVLLTVQYNLLEGIRMKPYIKFGMGGYYFQKRTDMGLYTFSNEYNWNFGIQPEAGILFPLNERIMINLNSRYNHILGNQSIDQQSYINIGLGIVFLKLGRE